MKLLILEYHPRPLFESRIYDLHSGLTFWEKKKIRGLMGDGVSVAQKNIIGISIIGDSCKANME